MTFETVKYEVKDKIATITVNRPDALNALNPQVIKELLEAAGLASKDSEVGAVIVTGEGRAFVAGADIKAMKDLTTTTALEFADTGHKMTLAFENMDKPVIAAVNGFALGGGTELSLACDFIIASKKAKFGQPEVSLGVIPGFGGTGRLVRTVGMNAARQLIFSGDIIDAVRAKEIGLVHEICEPEELMEKAIKIATNLTTKGPLAIAAAKRTINKGSDLSLDAALELEKQAFCALFGTSDQKEGMAAFIEKRKAEFTRS